MRGEEQDEVLLFFAVTFLSLEEGGINSQAQKKEEGAELETEMEMEMEMGEGPYLLENAMPGPLPAGAFEGDPLLLRSSSSSTSACKGSRALRQLAPFELHMSTGSSVGSSSCSWISPRPDMLLCPARTNITSGGSIVCDEKYDSAGHGRLSLPHPLQFLWLAVAGRLAPDFKGKEDDYGYCCSCPCLVNPNLPHSAALLLAPPPSSCVDGLEEWRHHRHDDERDDEKCSDSEEKL